MSSAMSGPEQLRLEGIDAGYGELTVLRDIDLSVGRGEVVALLGPNGAGKSTLLGAISGLIRPSRGRVWLDGRDITGLQPQRLVRLGLAHVPERRQVFGPMTVRENLLLGAHTRLGREPARLVESDIAAMFALFPALATRERQLAGTLSGGEQQMLAISRALMCRPSLLLLDEPSLGLAPLVAREIFRVISELPGRGCSVLLVEQNAHASLAIASRGYVLDVGRVRLAASAAALRDELSVGNGYLSATSAASAR